MASVQVVGVKIDCYKIYIDTGPIETRPTARKGGRRPSLAGRPRPFRNISTRQRWLPLDLK
jgi:hypothetical protein